MSALDTTNGTTARRPVCLPTLISQLVMRSPRLWLVSLIRMSPHDTSRAVSCFLAN